MDLARRVFVAVAITTMVGSPSYAQKSTIEQFMSAASPLQITVAKKADRIAWTAYERGMRNVYSAAAPAFKPVRITSFLSDDGEEVQDVRLSNDGRVAVFVRGSAPNREEWIANPTHDPAGAKRVIWAAATLAGANAAWPLVEGGSPELSPDGRTVLYVKQGQIYRARVPRTVARDSMDLGLLPFIKQWGSQSSPRWSPDGSRIAFVSSRGDHSFIGIYDVRSRKVDFVAPSVDCDASPTWSPDGKRIAFLRRPGTPFGRQAHASSPGIGNPAGPAVARAMANTCPTNFSRLGQPDTTRGNASPGLYTTTFSDSSTIKIMLADVAKVGDIMTSPAFELWHNARDDRAFFAINRLLWADDHLLFPLSPPNDEWDRYYSISVSHPSQPVAITTTDGLIEDATAATLSADGKMLYYSTNAKDIERRHLWAVPVAGGPPVQLSSGESIETSPLALPSGKQIAHLYFDAKQPASVGLMPATGGKSTLLFPTLPADFPKADHVVPQIVTVKSPDGLEVHSQLFVPADLKPGEKRPAIVFVHGGPVRQMLPGYHYMQFYHWAYGANQWLASQGYIVMSVNYRLGVGYGRAFQEAQQKGGGRGNAEYQDVLAAGRYLQSRPDVDSTRVGIWGLSYGGTLTAQALARNSDVFAAGVDLAGVHLWGNSLDTAAVSYKSSAIFEVDKWKSPVLLVHGDDDRNVNFAQTVGLVQLLRTRGVYHELIVIPDDTHESLLHSRWLYTWNRMGDFLRRFLWERKVATSAAH